MKILNFGSCNIDYVYSLSHIVNVGETLKSDNLSVFAGGKGLNQSIAISRAGANVYHAGCVGQDGKMLIDVLINNNVDISNINTVDIKTGHAIIQVSRDGENSIFIYAGSNGAITKEQVDRVLSKFDAGDILVLQNEINNINYIVEVAFEKGMKIVLNPSPINDTLSQIDFNKLSYIVLNEVEAKHFSGSDQPQKSLEYFGKNYPALRVMLTLGKNGCIYFEDGKSIAHPIFETAVVDSTAAGDTFLGYFVAGISKNHDIPAVLKYASAAAAIAVSREGASPSIPTLCEVKDALRTMKLRPSDMASKRILFLIDDYITKNIATANLTDLSKALGYSTVYTGRIVKKLTKLRFVDYLHTKRLTLSAQLLRDTEMSVSEIIKQCGYVNESYFRKIFKDRYNKTPLQYRRG